MISTLPHIGIVIVNWQRPDDTLACLQSLAQVDYPSYEVVVVDNGSELGFPARIREEFPDVPLIENGRNLGFAGGNNIGISYLMGRGARYVLLLNDDTEVDPLLLSRLAQVAESDPSIGILGPTIYYFEQKDVIWSGGGRISKTGEPAHLRLDEHETNAVETVQDVDYVTGCALLIRTDVIERIGALDERFFAYFEETEWCTRARRAGFRVVYVSSGRVWHKLSPGARARSRLYLYLMARNRLLYLACSGARPWVLWLATIELLRTAASWSLRPRHREMQPYVRALTTGVLHFAMGRFGAPPRSLVAPQ